MYVVWYKIICNLTLASSSMTGLYVMFLRPTEVWCDSTHSRSRTCIWACPPAIIIGYVGFPIFHQAKKGPELRVRYSGCTNEGFQQGECCFSSPNGWADSLACPVSFVVGKVGTLPGVKSTVMWNLAFSPGLRMVKSVLALPHMPSWRTPRQFELLYIYLCPLDECRSGALK